MIALLRALAEAFKEPLNALGLWLNPDRRREAIKDGAIESAEQLLLILRKQGRYKFFNEKKLKEYEEHFQKRFDAWRDGKS